MDRGCDARSRHPCITGMPADADGELRRRGNLVLDCAQAPHHLGDGQSTDRIQQLPMHAPRQRLRPADLHRHGSDIGRSWLDLKSVDRWDKTA